MSFTVPFFPNLKSYNSAKKSTFYFSVDFMNDIFLEFDISDTI